MSVKRLVRVISAPRRKRRMRMICATITPASSAVPSASRATNSPVGSNAGEATGFAAICAIGRPAVGATAVITSPGHTGMRSSGIMAASGTESSR